MLIGFLAQSASGMVHQIAPQDKALIHLMLIGAVLAVGLLMVIGLLVAWRNYNRRQRELDEARLEREADLPRPDAWATAAQRIAAEDAGPDEAHVAHEPADPNEDEQDPSAPDFGEPDEDEEDDDEDDFPFDTGDDEDDDGPIGRA